MTSEGIEKVKQIRDTEEQISKQIEDARKACEESLKKKTEEYESSIRRLTEDLQVKHDLALREKEANLQKKLEATLEEARDRAKKMNLNMTDKEIVDRIFEMMKQYMSE